MSTYSLLTRTSLLKKNNLRQFSSTILSSPFSSTTSISPSSSYLFSKKYFSTEIEGDLKKNKKNKKNSSELEGKYSSTIRLPTSPFSQRANSLEKEPELQSFWRNNKIYDEIIKKNSKTNNKFILHDGPPYANGDLHTGHALNKILKDIINRHQLLQGKAAIFVPGWDCHGLPIEFKVLQNLKKDEKENLTPIKLRKIAENYARSTVESQKKQFERLGVWANWDSPYLTLSPEYEAEQIKIFGDMVKKGHIYRGTKPVYWSPSSRTALAEAELEYNDKHMSKSIYLSFNLEKKTPKFEEFLNENSIPNDKNIQFLIWTTTPWTIPSNLAISVGPSIEYSLVSHEEILNGAHFLVAKDLVPSAIEKLTALYNEKAAAAAAAAGTPPPEVKELSFNTSSTSILGKDLEGLTYTHPLFNRVSPILVAGDYITTDSGTGLVHTAPGHGLEDYLTGLKNNLPPFSPVNEAGCYTKEVGDEELVGLDVLSTGNNKVIEKLKGLENTFIFVENYFHKYPYDWRTKKPTIFRATEQWFASLKNFKHETLDILNEKVNFYPPKSKNLLYNMIENREDWCISRQRNWGVPIPAFYHKDTREVLLNEATINHIENIFRERGSNAWWELSNKELLPKEYEDVADNYERGYDTMDVWFDSGTSWGGVLKARGLPYPADLYLEGNDQARGWFQSSLLTSVSTQSQAPYRNVLTHGMVLDEKGNKMSKSLGNVIDPLEIILGNQKNLKEYPPYGADTLRLWVSSTDYSGDVNIGQNIIKKTNENYRKIRLTFKYILGCLNDFQPPNGSFSYSESNLNSTSSIKLEDLEEIDQYILLKLNKLTKDIEYYYSTYQFSKINYLLLQFISQDLSSFYLNISKDRLYISEKDSFRLKSCQYTLSIILDQLMILLAPILPHLTEEIYQNLPYKVKDFSLDSVFGHGWISNEFYKKINVENKKFDEIFNKKFSYEGEESNKSYEEELENDYDLIKKLRNDFNKCVEIDIKNKKVSTSMENEFFVYLNKNTNSTLNHDRIIKRLEGLQESSPVLNNENSFINDFRFLFLCSKFEILKTKEEFINKIKESNKESINNLDEINLDILLNDKEYSSNLPKNFLTEENSESQFYVGIKKTEAKKCERCWYYCPSVGTQVHDDLCLRCSTIVQNQN